ncbi:hypothetical protein Kpol_1066p24 [Vanderwaltozyma polyspora DSM 70294]|uniref:RNA polymerase II-associated protein 1 n=1 Tax=Vanderwaltozyma polyspora (strain ATCC 22028 / DSM 70294 / BCRC 21397 / CBS 2163 / NBRC 10782 / NRRL Y-8283 / UCD 57-17) TaxID=436907 RepID=A7TMP5_VANPO|nr:uncharacterized protein Kpol_1066p24 [Vanderwaltozyma polyspora DSM 70294]EDO16459.1 hypothetical protein Kpol_1066p24 [Vanderwaltozyma polyspora DSM 70294]
MSKKQEYIAKISYQNNLPPPLLPPSLLKFQDNENENADSPQLITSLYTKTNVNSLVNLDSELGMPLDLFKIPGLLNNSDTKFLNGFENVRLHADDRILLRDPRVDRLTKTDISKVSFLRRTEYISTSISSHSDSLTSNKKRTRDSSHDEDDDRILNSHEISEKVEGTFEKNSEDLSSFRHPIKKKLQAVKSWKLLPDTSSMDQNYFTLRLVGSATLSKQEKNTLALQTTIFRPVELEEDDWISMYTTDVKDSKILSNELEKKIDDSSNGLEKKVYKFKRLRDFDMKQIQTMENMGPSQQTQLNDLALIFNDEKKAVYYKPIRSKIELRSRRVNDVIRPLVREHNLDQINISLRNPTTQESNLRDKLRTKFDPIDFPYVDEDEDENEKGVESSQQPGEQHDSDGEESLPLSAQSHDSLPLSAQEHGSQGIDKTTTPEKEQSSETINEKQEKNSDEEQNM